MGAQTQEIENQTVETTESTDPLYMLSTEGGKAALIRAAKSLRDDKGDEPDPDDDDDEKDEEEEDKEEETKPEGQPKKDAAKKDDKKAAKKDGEDDGKKDDDAEDREKSWHGLRAVQADRRRFNQEKEQALAEITKREQAIAGKEEVLAKVERGANNFRAYPGEFVEALGITDKEEMKDIALGIYVHAVGVENLPAEWQEKVRGRGLKAQVAVTQQQAQSEVQKLREEMMQERLAAQQAEFRADIKTALSAVDADELPHVAMLAKDDPKFVVDMIYQMADAHVSAMRKAGYDWSEIEIPGEAELIKQYEANLAKELEKFSPLYARKAKGKAKGQQEGQGKSGPRSITPTMTQGAGRKADKGKRDPEERMARALVHLQAATDSYKETMSRKPSRPKDDDEDDDD